MPNWSTQSIKIEKLNDKGKEFGEILSQVIGEKDNFDFNKIIPMPKELEVESSSVGDDCLKYYVLENYDKLSKQDIDKVNEEFMFENLHSLKAINYTAVKERIKNIMKNENIDKEKVLEIGKKYFDNVLKYGCKDWYHWCNTNWGTKWNACETYLMEEENEIMFDTAWSPALPIIEQLSKMFPNNKFKFTWVEEQISEYGGEGTFINGESQDYKEFEANSKELYELYFKMLGGEENFKFNEEIDTYEWIEEEEE